MLRIILMKETNRLVRIRRNPLKELVICRGENLPLKMVLDLEVNFGVE
jgi:hypothetical protein